MKRSRVNYKSNSATNIILETGYNVRVDNFNLCWKVSAILYSSPSVRIYLLNIFF